MTDTATTAATAQPTVRVGAGGVIELVVPTPQGPMVIGMDGYTAQAVGSGLLQTVGRLMNPAPANAPGAEALGIIDPPEFRVAPLSETAVGVQFCTPSGHTLLYRLNRPSAEAFKKNLLKALKHLDEVAEVLKR